MLSTYWQPLSKRIHSMWGVVVMTSTPLDRYPNLQQILRYQKKIVYLCGAGASMTLGAHQNSWQAWLLAGRGRLAPKPQKGFDARVGTSSTHELIEAASFLLNELKKDGSYLAFMDETIGSLHPANPVMKSALQKIWRAGDLLSTTNYDMLLEETVSSGYVTYERPGEILTVIRGDSQNRIIHLHGIYDKAAGIDNIIADEDQYRNILENEGAQFIQNLLSTYPILIVGCGGTVTDPNLAGFMQFMVDKLGVNVPYFYLLREGDALPPLPTNAVPICYGQEYSDLPAFLDELAAFRLRSRAQLQGLVLVDPYAPAKRLFSAFGRMHFANRFSEFTGRKVEQSRLNRFLSADGHILWWGVLGEGGIGKSRLLLEWLRELPPRWYGFFARKAPQRFINFTPFTDTVIVLDYILGEEEEAARTIESLLTQFEDSSYQLRLLLIERHQNSNMEDWLSELYQHFTSPDRLIFDSYRYLEGAVNADTAELMCLEPFTEDEELCYIQGYLKNYVPIFLPETEAVRLLGNLEAVSRRILKYYRHALDELYRRPLFLSILIEVWVNRNGEINITGVKHLLRAYLTKEIDRWKSSLGTDQLVNAYLKLLAVSCAAGQFNITDPLGREGYLREERAALIAFLDEQDCHPGIRSVFEDLFVERDELVAFDPEKEETILDVFNRSTYSEGMSEDEKFAFAAPYIKLETNPEEVYLTMLQSAEVATEAELNRLEQLHVEREQRKATLPDHAWIITPDLPDIIREYIVLFVVKPRDIEHFTKFVRANSIYGVDRFLAHALEDWPDEPLIRQMSVIPPDAVLDYFEYYLPLLVQTRQISDFAPVETIMLQGEATLPFAKYEMELWFRIAIVLEERGDWTRLLDSGKQFLRYMDNSFEHPKVQERAVEILSAYCVGLHNAEQADLLDDFLTACDTLVADYPEDPNLALFCCDNRRRLLHLRRYLKCPEHLEQDWEIIVGYLTAYPNSLDICRSAVSAADEYYTWLRHRNEDIIQQTEALANLLDEVFRRHALAEAAGLLAQAAANLYMLTRETDTQKAKKFFDQVQDCYKRCPGSKQVRSAYASVISQQYLDGIDRQRDVPSKVLARLKKWSNHYPEDIEFQEAYFKMLFVHISYILSRGKRGEAARIFRELTWVAQNANYEEYGEENRLIQTVEYLRLIYGFK